jgi:hypothetical protein
MLAIYAESVELLWREMIISRYLNTEPSTIRWYTLDKRMDKQEECDQVMEFHRRRVIMEHDQQIFLRLWDVLTGLGGGCLLGYIIWG